jgi:L-ascorbate metabolism protein UlaG (beta-lactamase superfamily)
VKSKKRSGLRRVVLWTGALLVIALVGTAADAWTAMGGRAEGARRARMERSPQWKDSHFVNPQPLVNDMWGSVTAMLGASPDVSPRGQPLPSVKMDPQLFQTLPASGLRATWMGHSTVLLEIDGHRVLTDPVWSDRASPLTWVGPRRWYVPTIALAELPSIDAVVISHDHYDHLDYGTLSAMKDWNTTFIVPLGVGAHLESWGVPAAKIVELDWWESAKVGQLEVFCTPARHASGRALAMDSTLWAGYAFVGPSHRAYYSGDTGLFPAMKDIGERLGPFDVTMIEVGQYNQAWPDWHIGPEQAVTAHRMLKGRVLLPVHWGLFPLAAHGWTEPIERVLAEAGRTGEKVLVTRPGQSVEPGAPPAIERWWPDLPWKTAAQDPIVSTQMN